MKKTWIFGLACVLLVAFAAGCEKQPEKLTIEKAQSWDSVKLASLDDNEVLLSNYVYWYRINQTEMENEALSGGSYTEENLASYWDSEVDGVKARDLIRDNSFVEAKEYAVLIKMARDAGTTLDETETQKTQELVDGVVASMSEDPAEADQVFLDAYGITPVQMKEMYMGMDTIEKHLQHLSETIEVNDAEIKAIYDADPEQYEQAIVRHVLIMCNAGMTEEEQEAARLKAEDILAQLNAGADIAELAKEHSEDEGSKDNNGEYIFPRGVMVEEFEEWSFSANEGDKDIVKTDYGYHVMQYMGRGGYEEVRDALRTQAAYDKVNKIVDDALETAQGQWETDEEALNSITPDKPE